MDKSPKFESDSPNVEGQISIIGSVVCQLNCQLSIIKMILNAGFPNIKPSEFHLNRLWVIRVKLEHCECFGILRLNNIKLRMQLNRMLNTIEPWLKFQMRHPVKAFYNGTLCLLISLVAKSSLFIWSRHGQKGYRRRIALIF